MASLFSQITSGLSKAKGSSGAGQKDDAVLYVNGKTFQGWTEISIKRTLKAISGSFDLRLIDKWAEEQTPWLVIPGDSCQVKIGDETLITGYVDNVSPSFSSTQRAVSISGRDKAGDLVDCSAEHKPGNWTKISLDRLADLVCSPFGVSVSNPQGISTETLKYWRIQPGEKVFETLDRAAKLSGVLLVNDGVGGIEITRAGSERASTRLVQGINIISASAVYDNKDRFSKYTVKSQSGGYDEETPAIDFASSGTSTDAVIKRFRPLTIVAEGASSLKICQTRARWEASVRAAKSARFTVTVYGWHQENGTLWEINKIVNMSSNFLGVNQDFLISSVTFSKGSNGTTTTLELERPEAYSPDPTIKAQKDPLTQLVQQDRARR